MQEVKDLLKNLGKHFQTTKSSHQATLREKLAAQQGEVAPVRLQPFSWMPFLSAGIAGVAILVGVVKFTEPHYAIIPEYDEVASYDSGSMVTLNDSTGLAATDSFLYADEYEASDVAHDAFIRAPSVQNIKSTTGEIVDYEEAYGAMLEEYVRVSLLTKKDDAAVTVSELIASLGGHLASLRDNEEYASISGSIPLAKLSFFYEQLDDLVKNDAFIEKTMHGESVTSEALDLSDRMDALRIAETDVTTQLQNAKTEEEKKTLQKSLESISKQIDDVTAEQEALEDRVDYVEVSVSIERLSSIWEVDGGRELREVIAGYETPNLWQRVVINALTVFLVALEVLSATFWVVIPLMIFVVTRLKRRRMLRELD